jgi:uncharacterized membrane protein YhaH (DUF805 family)
LDSRTFFWLFFGLSGRISRMAYFLAGLLLYLARFFPVYKILVHEGNESLQTFWGGIFLLVIGATLVCHIALAVKRLHDMGLSGWFSMLFLIGDFLFYMFLCLAPGKPGSNRFGSQTNAPK